MSPSNGSKTCLDPKSFCKNGIIRTRLVQSLAARTLRIPGALGTIGFISPLGEHFCQNCNRLRLTSDGKLRSCLVIPNEVSLRDAVRSGQPLENFFEQAIAQKPEHHDMLVAVPAGSQRGMSQIGG